MTDTRTYPAPTSTPAYTAGVAAIAEDLRIVTAAVIDYHTRGEHLFRGGDLPPEAWEVLGLVSRILTREPSSPASEELDVRAEELAGQVERLAWCVAELRERLAGPLCGWTTPLAGIARRTVALGTATVEISGQLD